MNGRAEHEFNAAQWQRLDWSERLRRCRLYAEQARQLSADATPQLKESYFQLSRHWLALAVEIESYARETGQSSARLQPGAP